MTRPVFTLELDDATNSGTWPTNISNRFDLRAGWSIRRGRANGQNTADGATFSCTLKNNDGALTRGGALGTFKGQRIRMTITIGGVVSRRFTGYVPGWPVSIEGGPAKKAIVRISAVDRWPGLNRQTMGSAIRQSVLALNPVGYYPLDEPATATSASNVALSPVTALSLTQFGTGSNVAFAGATGVGTDPSPVAAAFSGSSKVLTSAAVPNVTSPAAATLAVVVQTTAVSQSVIVYGSGTGTLSLSVDSLGRVAGGMASASASSGLTGTVINDGKAHLLLIRYNGVSTTDLLVDGAVVATSTDVTGTIGTISPFVTIASGVVTPRYSGSVSHAVVTHSLVTNAQAAALWDVMKTGGASDSSAARITRLLGYAGVPASELLTETPVLTAVPPQAVQAQNPLSAIQAVDLAEGGLTFTRGDGKIAMQNRQHRAMQIAPVVTIPTANLVPDSDTQVDDDDQQLLNYVTASRVLVAPETSTPQMISQDPTSLNTVGYYSDDTSGLLVPNDAQVQDYADWRRSTRANPGARIESLKVAGGSADQTLQQQLLALEISDRIRLGTGYPTQFPATGDQCVEGITESGNQTRLWDLELNTTPWSIQQAWVLGDTTYGVLDVTTRLHY